MRNALTLLAVFLLAGCARGHWEYPGPASEANRLAYDCQYMANMQAKGAGYFTAAIAESQFRQCLESRGFRWISEATTDSSSVSGSSYSDPDKNKKYKYGYVDVNDLKKNNKYLIKYCIEHNGCGDESVFLEEAKRQASKYCQEYGYDFLTIKNSDLRDFTKGYLCPPKEGIRNEDLSRFTDGNATGDMSSFIDRTNGMKK